MYSYEEIKSLWLSWEGQPLLLAFIVLTLVAGSFVWILLTRLLTFDGSIFARPRDSNDGSRRRQHLVSRLVASAAIFVLGLGLTIDLLTKSDGSVGLPVEDVALVAEPAQEEPRDDGTDVPPDQGTSETNGPIPPSVEPHPIIPPPYVVVDAPPPGRVDVTKSPEPPPIQLVETRWVLIGKEESSFGENIRIVFDDKVKPNLPQHFQEKPSHRELMEWVPFQLAPHPMRGFVCKGPETDRHLPPPEAIATDRCPELTMGLQNITVTHVSEIEGGMIWGQVGN